MLRECGVALYIGSYLQELEIGQQCPVSNYY